MAVTYDNSPDFVTAVSMLAALEGASLPAGEAECLPYLGMARAELTDYGQRLPSHFEVTPVPSFRDGLFQLEVLLTRMLSASQDLTVTLRLHASLQILRERVRS